MHCIVTYDYYRTCAAAFMPKKPSVRPCWPYGLIGCNISLTANIGLLPESIYRLSAVVRLIAFYVLVLEECPKLGVGTLILAQGVTALCREDAMRQK